MEKQLKRWQIPQLIILARGTPEENILANCKAISAINPLTPGNFNQSNCGFDTPNCSACQARGGGAS